MSIILGTLVKDRVTGLVGVAENRAEFIYGCDRYFVQPQVDKDGKIPEGYMMDEPQLEPVEGVDAVMPPPVEPKRIFAMGKHVLDPIRGAKGIITGRAVYLNGCARVMISPKQAHEKDLCSWWVDEQQPNAIEGQHPTPSKKENDPGGPAPSSSKH